MRITLKVEKYILFNNKSRGWLRKQLGISVFHMDKRFKLDNWTYEDQEILIKLGILEMIY